MRKVFLIGLLQYWFVQVAFPQNDHYSIRNYTAVDGLPQSQVWGFTEDRNGYLWVCTEGGGLARFDGREFKVYTTQDGLLSNEVMRVLMDDHQRLWILHRRGVTRFDGFHFKKFQLPGTSNFAKEMFNSRDTVFLVDLKGSLTKIHNDSIYYSSRPFSSTKTIRWVHTTPDGILCFFMKDGTCHVEIRENESLTAFDVAIPGKYLDVINWKKNLLINTEEGLFMLHLREQRLLKMSWTVPVTEWMLQYDEKRNILWSSSGNLLFKETLKNNQLQRDTVLRGVGVHDVLLDSEGNTWFASDGRGLYKYFIQDFDRFTNENIQGVMAILKDKKGSVWLGTMSQGLWRIKDGKTISYPETQRDYRNAIRTIKQAPDGTIWVASSHGLGKYDETTDKFQWFTRDDGLSGHSILALEFDDRGGMWAGSQNGMIYFDGKSFHNLNVKKMGNGLLCWAMHYSTKYKTFFFNTDIGMSGIKNGSERAAPFLEFPTLITNIRAYNDSLLIIGTGGNGALIYNPVTHQKHPLTVHEGLASDFVYFITQDEKGYLWVGTEKGIDRLRLNNTFESVENIHYGFENGLAGVETNQNAFYFGGKEKYFGLVDGAYEFNDLQAGKKTFDLHLTDVQILYGEYPASKYADSLYGFFKIPYKPIFPPDKNHVTFHFNRVDKQHPKSVKFKYFLENFDKAWSPPSSTRQVTYGNLPPGEYVFRVMATDPRGSWASTSIAYPFTVRSPFYLRTSFILGSLILITGIITLALYIRVKQRIRAVVEFERVRMKEQETLRKGIAQDFHDEMGNHLTRIINYISLLKLNGNGNHQFKQHELYSKVEDSAKYLYAGTRDFIWGIDPVNDELSKLFIHVRDFGEKLFEEKNINFRAFNEVREKIKLPYGFSREANLIFKEAMTNAFKYSEAKNITFSLNRVEDDFELMLQDDGIGFYCGEIENSNGLKNIRERAGRISAVLRIISGKDQGTRIILNFNHSKKLNYGATV